MCPDGSPDAIDVNAMAFLPRVLLPAREEEESSGSGVIEVGRGCTRALIHCVMCHHPCQPRELTPLLVS